MGALMSSAPYRRKHWMVAKKVGPSTITFGSTRYQYYETISGGSGAGGVWDADGKLVGGFDGTSVVQCHMTNSRLTDPEVLEFRFPVRLEGYEIRKRPGGAGQYKGGDGGIRRVRFLEPMTASILSNGRHHGAFGMAGGQSGATGINKVVRDKIAVDMATRAVQALKDAAQRVTQKEAERRAVEKQSVDRRHQEELSRARERQRESYSSS
eukprot:gene37818-46665_t